MMGGTLTPLRDGVHLRGQDRVSQKRPFRIPPTRNKVSYMISSFVNINWSIFFNHRSLKFLLELEKFSLPLLPPDPNPTRFSKLVQHFPVPRGYVLSHKMR